MKVSALQIDSPAGRLSARVSGPQEAPRGLVIALHGGTYDSSYYEGEQSLLAAGAALGLCVVALDRPGYGDSAETDPRWTSFDGQTEALAAALPALIAQIAPRDGTILIGHSIGGMIALRLAATGALPIGGVEVSGIGVQWQPGLKEMWASFVSDQPALAVPPEAHAQVMLGEPDTHTAEQVAQDAALLRPMPMPELVDVVGWAEDFPGVAAQVAVPVSITFPEQDRIWATDDGARVAAAALFSASPAVHTAVTALAGHSTELHRRGPGYALRQLAFAEDCLSGV